MAETKLSDSQLRISVRIATKFALLGIQTKFIEPVIEGPVVSIYRFQPEGSTRVSHIESLAPDLAVSLGVEDVFVKRMPGEEAVGIFVPNEERKWVNWRDICGVYGQAEKPHIPLLLGIDNLGNRVVEDLSTFPHLLVAGSTGAGKSTLLNSILATIIYNCSSNDVQIVISDTKGVDFGHFVGAPHLLYDPATSVYRTLEQLDYLLAEMESRLRTLAKGGHRNILEYNQDSRNAKDRLPYILFLIDELADLLLNRSRTDQKRSASFGKISSQKLSELASKARASGIHCIASTQRPSVKLLEGDIKSNFTARLSFRLPSFADSTTVLSTGGAEHLLSRGDMLFQSPNSPGLRRIHAPFASIEDIKAAIEVAGRRELSNG